MNRPVLSKCLLVFLLALGLIACGDSGKSTEDYIARAKGYQDVSDYKSAVIELKNALRQSPDNAEVRELLGTVYLKVGDGASAEKEILRSVELGRDPQSVIIPLLSAQIIQGKFKEVAEAEVDMADLSAEDQLTLWILRAEAQVGLGELDEAAKMYDAAIALQPDSAGAGLGMARLAAERGDLKKARERVEAVIIAHEDFAPASSFLGEIEQFEGNMKLAEAAFTRALELSPGTVNDLANRALTRIALGDLAGARSDIADALAGSAAKPAMQPLALYARGRLFLTQNNYENAAQSFENTLKLEPDYLPARFFLAVSQFRLGRFEQAEQNINIFRSAAPQFPGGHRLYAAVKYSQGEYEVAQAELENILSFDPDDSWAISMLADVAVVTGDADQSIENYRKIADLYPESEMASMNLSLGLMMIDQEQAREVLTESSAFANGSPQARMLLVVSYLKSGEWGNAIAEGEKLVADEPGNWDAYTLLGAAFLGSGDAEKAGQMFKKALEVKPGNPNAANNLARLELKAGNEAAARGLYEQVLENYPSSNEPLLSLSAMDFNQGKFQEAIARLERGVTAQPQNLQLRLALARLYLRTGQPSRNLNLAFEVGEAEAGNPLVLEILGDSQAGLGQYDAALVTFEKLATLRPADAAVHYRLAHVYASTNQLDRASQELQKVIDIQPDHFGAVVMRIRLLRKQNRQDETVKLFEELDARFLNRPEIIIEQGWLAMYQQQYKQAAEAFARAYELVPSSIVALQYGIALWNSGEQERALQVYQDWLQANPADIQVLFHLGNSYMQLGRDQEAVVAFQTLLEQKPDDTIVMNNLAWLLRDSDPKKALQFAERTIKIAPEWAPGLDTMGYIVLNRGDTAKAYRYFEQALKQTPEDPEIRYHLALASSQMGEKEQAVQILKAILAEPAAMFESRKDAEKLLLSLKE